MITDYDYRTWLRRSKRTDVILVDITTAEGAVLRFSTKQFKTDSLLYRARLTGFEITQEIESGLAGYSVFGIGDLVLANSDHKLDAWKDLTLQTVSVRYGDSSWPIDDFRVIQTGQFYDVAFSSDNLRIRLRDRQANLDRLVTSAQITTTSGLPGNLVTSIMVESGEFTLSDIDLPSFNNLDSVYPYSCSIAITGDGENLADVLDRVLSGFPCDYGIGTDGKVRCHVFKLPETGSLHRPFVPVAKPDLERISPFWQVRLTSFDDSWAVVDETRPLVRSSNPDARLFAASSSISNRADATTLASQFLDLFSGGFERFTLRTNASVSGLQILDTVSVRYPNFGYRDGKLGVVAKIANRVRDFSELEVWVG